MFELLDFIRRYLVFELAFFTESNGVDVPAQYTRCGEQLDAAILMDTEGVSVNQATMVALKGLGYNHGFMYWKQRYPTWHHIVELEEPIYEWILGSVVQPGLEQRTHNSSVVGSNPTAPT